MFWAPMAGAALVLLNFQLPMALAKGFAILGNTTEGAALFVTGLVASAQKFRLSPELGMGRSDLRVFSSACSAWESRSLWVFPTN